ncbi:acyltransferase family protein [Thalassotalea piscium]
MFGTLRTLWATMVVIGHIFWLGDFGRFAVFGFYILSGYLMTYVMHNSYGYSAIGTKKFATNRFLRLYPAFWVAGLCSLILIYFWGWHTNKISLPNSFYSLFGNITMVYPHWMPNQILPRLSPATWALTVELFFYVAIALGISKTLRRTYIWLGLSIAYVIMSYWLNLFWHARYFSIPAGSLPFSLGALIFFLSQKKETSFIPKVILDAPFTLFIISLSIAVITTIAINKNIPFWLMECSFYLCMLINFLLVLSLATGKEFIKGLSKRLDKKIGDYSYPFYLLHYQAAAFAGIILFNQPISLKENATIDTLLLTFVILIFISLAIITIIDKPIETIRRKVRPKK